MQREVKAHYVGACNEYVAASYYLNKEYQVYWPSVQQGAVDFVIKAHNTAFQRVQVKTATWNKSDAHFYLQCRVKPTNKHQEYLPTELYDILFVVGPEGDMWEIPAEALDSSNVSLKLSSGKATRWDKYRLPSKVVDTETFDD
jgi:hypothetical protein